MTALVYFLVDADGQEARPRVRIVEEAPGGDHWFADMASSGSTRALERPGFSEFYRFARKGDTLVISSLDCLSTNRTELRTVLRHLKAKGVAVTSVREGLHLFDSGGPAIQAVHE